MIIDGQVRGSLSPPPRGNLMNEGIINFKNRWLVHYRSTPPGRPIEEVHSWARLLLPSLD